MSLTFVTNRVVEPTLIGNQVALSASQLAETDELLLHDTSSQTLRKVTLNNLMNFIGSKGMAIVTFTCGVGSGDNLPGSMALAYNPFGLDVSINANRIALGSGNWQIETAFSAYYQSWNGWLGGMYSDQFIKTRVQIDGGDTTIEGTGSGLYTTTGSSGLGSLSNEPVDSVVQVKVASSGFVTPIRNIANITGGIGTLAGGRCTAYVYKI